MTPNQLFPRTIKEVVKQQLKELRTLDYTTEGFWDIYSKLLIVLYKFPGLSLATEDDDAAKIHVMRFMHDLLDCHREIYEKLDSYVTEHEGPKPSDKITARLVGKFKTTEDYHDICADMSDMEDQIIELLPDVKVAVIPIKSNQSTHGDN